MDEDIFSGFGGKYIPYTDFVDLRQGKIYYYALNANLYKTVDSAANKKIPDIAYFTIRNPESIKENEIKKNLYNIIKGTVNLIDGDIDENRIDTNKTAFDITEEIKESKIKIYHPQKVIPIDTYLKQKVLEGKEFTKEEIININTNLIKIYKDYFGFCEYINGLGRKN